jgi:PhzF family phenazine biosynthesis protein
VGGFSRVQEERAALRSQYGSHTLSRRSFLSLAPILGVLMSIGKTQADQEEHKQEPGNGQWVEVVHTRVFAAGTDGGNPCPVILSADHLDAREMQALARKFGLDTVFILTSQSKEADIRLRYFVPQHEMGVSGHATVAAITVAMRDGKLKSDRVRIETLNGIFAVNCAQTGNQLLVTLEQNPPIFGPAVPPSMVTRALRISLDDIITQTPVESVSVSRPKLLVPLRDAKVLAMLKPDFDALWTLCDAFRVSGVYPFARNTDKANADVEARQFPLRAGFPEDAATGVAAAALGAYLVKYDRQCRTGEYHFRIAQGYAMGAPSLIEVLVDCEANKITRTAICGEAEIIGRERVTLQ